jgi:pyruvate dehydrogenase E2 component (dihydrolipoamide acetyltransferase)
MEAGTLVEWLVKPGDQVKRGDIVAVVETQKGAIEIEIFEAGQVEQLLIDLNTKVPVGTPLARIRAEPDIRVGIPGGPPRGVAPIAPPASVPGTPEAPERPVCPLYLSHADRGMHAACHAK